MANSLSEGFIRTTYVSESGVHHQILPINFSGTPTAGVEPDLQKKDGTSIGAEAGLALFIAEYAKFFDATTDFGLAEAYMVDADDEERHFIYGWNINESGVAVSANVPLGMVTLTWKTVVGGIIRVVAMEGVTLPNQKVRPPYVVDTPFADLSDYMVSGDSIVVGRDNNYAFAPISFTSKYSDVLRKREGL